MNFDPQSNHTPAGLADHADRRQKRPGSGSLSTGVIVVVVASAAALGSWIWFQSTGGPAQAGAAAPSVTGVPVVIVTAPDEASTTTIDAGRTVTAKPVSQGDPEAVEPVSEEQSESRKAFERGRTLSAVGRHSDAVPHLTRAVDLDPEFAEARYRLGIAYVLTGDRRAARAQRSALDEIDPNLANLLANLIQ